MNTLTIARYKDGYIKISEYNKTIHKNGEIFCPLCNPPLAVTGVENKFFRALPNRGGHNCNRRAVVYFNAEWKGGHLVETIKGNDGEIEITIDINGLDKMRKGLSGVNIYQELKDNVSDSGKEKYNRYKNYKDVLRDIVRTVSQMKRLIEQNSVDELGKIKFKYKMGNEELGINEIVVPVDELNKKLHNKERFVIYVIDTIRPYNGKIYINSYKTEGKTITISFDYPSDHNQTGLNKDDMIISFGKIRYYEKEDRYYLNALSDLNIEKINDKELIERFNNKKMNSWTPVKSNNTLEKKEHNIGNTDLIKTLDFKDMTSYQKTNEQEQKNQDSEIKEVIQNNISNGSNYEDDVASKEQVSKENGFFSKVFKKLSSMLTNR